MDRIPCPACERGTLHDSKCDRCGCGIARGSSSPSVTFTGRRPKFRGDQDTINEYTDYARTKADK